MRLILSKSLLPLILIGLAASTQGCAQPIYGFGVYNAASAKIHEVSIEYRLGHRVHKEYFGSIGKGGQPTINGNPRPIPRRFIVSWNPENGPARSVQVDRPHIKDEDKFDGYVWFRISDAGVTVLTMTMDEETDGRQKSCL